MDEYLSKPLKQNQLIQTILKFSQPGRYFLERGNGSDAPDDRLGHDSRLTPPVLSAIGGHVASPKRPGLDMRSTTEMGPSSPSIVSADASDPFNVRSYSNNW